MDILIIIPLCKS